MRRVFFSFHYERDIWRVCQIRNAWVTKSDLDEAGYIDHAAWEKLEREGKDAINRWIDRQLEGTSVTAILIGKETSEREWVQEEIKKSFSRGNGLVGIYIDRVKDQYGDIDVRGTNPLTLYTRKSDGKRLSDIYPSYDWVGNDGRANFGDWVEKAAQIAGRA